MKRLLLIGLVGVVASGMAAALAVAQTPAPQTPPAGRGAGTAGRGSARSTAPARVTTVRVAVHGSDGASLDGVKITLSGTSDGEFSTEAAGTAVMPGLKQGLYRIRCEKNGFVTLEREFQVTSGGLSAVDIVLNAAPPPPPPPPPPPAPAAPASAPSGPPVTLSIPDYLDHNLIGREPIKESIVACKPAETVRLLQLKDNLAAHEHDRTDEVLYVVAGDGAIRIGEQTTVIKPGSVAVVPHGAQHAIERRSKTPLILLSTLSGAACTASTQTQ